MGLLGVLFPKKTLENITIDELERERIILNEEEQRLSKELGKKEEGKEVLIQQGFKITTQSQMRIQAQRVRVVEEEIGALSKKLDSLFTEIRALNFLTIAKKSLLKSKEKSLLRGIIDQYSVDQFATMITDIKVKLGFDDQKLEEIINVLGTSSDSNTLDPYMQQMMETWEKGRESPSIEKELEMLDSSQHKISQENLL